MAWSRARSITGAEGEWQRGGAGRMGVRPVAAIQGNAAPVEDHENVIAVESALLRLSQSAGVRLKFPCIGVVHALEAAPHAIERAGVG